MKGGDPGGSENQSISGVTSVNFCRHFIYRPEILHTLGAVGSQLCGARGAVVDFLPEPGFKPTTLGFKSNALSIRPRLMDRN